MKTERHAKILELINQYSIETQDELAQKLKEAGFRVTQATVSRDIRDLKLTKMSVDGKQRYTAVPGRDLRPNEKYFGMLREGVVSMDMAQNILVIKTAAGMAMAVAAALDALEWPEIIGCIAGDDTIFCAVRTVDEAMLAMERLRRALSGGGK